MKINTFGKGAGHMQYMDIIVGTVTVLSFLGYISWPFIVANNYKQYK